MRLPRGLISNDVPTGPVVIDSPTAGIARIANQVTEITDRLLDDKARTELSDFAASAEAQTNKFLGRLESMHVDDDSGDQISDRAPRELDSFFSGIEKATSKSLTTSRARGESRLILRQLQAKASVEVDTIVRRKLFEHNQVRSTQAIEKYVELGNFDSAHNVLLESRNYYSPAETSKLLKFIDSAEKAAAHTRQVAAIADQAALIRTEEGTEAAATYLQQIADENLDGFTDEARAEAVKLGLAEIRQAEALQARADATQETARRVERSLDYSTFLRGISSATQDVEIEAFIRSHAITDQGKVNQLFRVRDEKVDSQTVFQSDFVDPTNKKVRDQVDLRLGEVFKDPSQRLNAAIAVAADTGIAASSLERFFEGASRSPEAFVEAANRYRQFREQAPAAYLPLSDGTKALFSQAATLTRAGMDPVLAANTAWEIVNNSTPEQIQDRVNNYPADEIVGEVISDLNDIPGLHKPGLFVDRTADVPAEMAGDMNRIGLAVYQRTGSIDAARDAVRNNIVNAWQFTDVNEGVSSGETELDAQYMKFAPRRGTEFVRKRLAEELGDQQFFFDNQVQSVDPSRIELWQPPLPEQNELGQPVWTLRVDGQFLLDERGQVVRWTYELPPGTEKPIRKKPEVTPAGFISLPAQKNATGTINRGFN